MKNFIFQNFKNTPLHWCVISKCVEGAQQLLNLGADFNLVNKFGQTPLQLAETISLEIFNIIDKVINIHFQFYNNQNLAFFVHTLYVYNNDIFKEVVPLLSNHGSQNIKSL